MKILVIDIGGTNVKLLATGHEDAAQIPVRSGADPGTDGRRRPVRDEGLGLRGGLDRISGAGAVRATDDGTRQPRSRLDGV